MTDAPLRAARALRARGHDVALLYSARPGRFAARSLLAARPDEVIVARHGGGLPAIPPRLVHAAGGQGLWLGAISYDAGLDLLGIPSRHATAVPAFVASYHRSYASYDHAADRFELHGPPDDALTAAIAEEASDRVFAPPAARVAHSSATRAQHERAAAEVRRLIALGEAFEINLAHVIETPWTAGGFELFERLVARSGGDHSAYLALGGVELASISPELFLEIDGDRVETRPIKGTRPRGTTATEDEAIERELTASEKDRAENVMIVDLLRNDLTETAIPGTVVVDELCVVERTPSVMHLVSSIVSYLRPEIRQPDVLVSCFPGGSITGAPKRRAIELIDRLERAPRGFYCGSIFAWRPAERHLRASIAIRTAEVRDGVARYGTGGAVTLLSDPAEEAEETIVKATPFLQATNATLDGW